MLDQSSTELYRNLVERIFVIDDITTGDQKDGYIVRYRGHLRSDDSEMAYDQLAGQMRPYNITPLFRKEDGRQAILLVDGCYYPQRIKSLDKSRACFY